MKKPACYTELREGDGIDPRYESRRHRRATRHKATQLCSQVAQALDLAFAACADSVLHNLHVVAVQPAPHTGRLLVTVALAVTCDVAADAVLAHLANANGRLRSDVATAIHRRRTPELSFRLAVKS